MKKKKKEKVCARNGTENTILMSADFAVAAVVSINARAAADDSPSPLVVVIIVKFIDCSRERRTRNVYLFWLFAIFRKTPPLKNEYYILRADCFDEHTTHGRIKKSIRVNELRKCVVEHCAHDSVLSEQYDTHINTFQQNPKV